MMSGRHYGAVAAVIGLPCEHPETAPLARCRACRRSRCHTRWGGMPAYGAIPTVVASADAGRSCPNPALAGGENDRLSWVDTCHSAGSARATRVTS